MKTSKHTFRRIITISIILILSISSVLAANTGTVNTRSTSFQDIAKEDNLGKFRQPPHVSLTSTKRTVEATDPAIITLSMINPSVNDMNLSVDVIIKAPTGVYITATSFVSSGSNQNIGHFVVRPGEENHLTIQITSTELGEKQIESQVTYYPEGNKDEYRTLQPTMSVYVKEKSQEINPPEKINLDYINTIAAVICALAAIIAIKKWFNKYQRFRRV